MAHAPPNPVQAMASPFTMPRVQVAPPQFRTAAVAAPGYAGQQPAQFGVQPMTCRRHHGPYFAGEHVCVKHYGGATVQTCTHLDKYGGRVEVRYDEDGTVYHCYTSQLTPWPKYIPQAVPVSAKAHTPKKQHGPFHVGEHVMVKGYGCATVTECTHGGQYPGRVEITYDDDGSIYHPYPSKVCPILADPAQMQQPHIPPVARASAPPQLPATVQQAPFTVGERIFVKGYGFATVADLPSHGKHAGAVKVRYDDGSTYHCWKEELLHLQVPKGAPKDVQLAPDAQEASALQQKEFPIGGSVFVKGYGIAVVDAHPTSGKYAGRVTVRYPDGSAYNCYAHELIPVQAKVQSAPVALSAQAAGPQKRIFEVGQKVTVKGYGVALVDALPTEGKHKGRVKVRVKVRYPDESTFHCQPEELSPVAATATPPNTPAEGLSPVAKTPAAFVQAPLQLGDSVMVKGYGVATVIELPTTGKYAGRVKVRYPDGTTYHCWQHELSLHDTGADLSVGRALLDPTGVVLVGSEGEQLEEKPILPE